MRTTIIAITALLSLAACHRSGSNSSADEGHAPDINVALPEQRTVTLRRNYPGRLHAIASVPLVARVSGYLKSRNYADGAPVEKGALLFTIEDTQYRNAVTQASGQLKSAAAELDYNTAHYTAVSKAAESDAASRMEVELSLIHI